MSKIKKIFTNTRVIIALIFVILAIAAINPNPWAKGVAIRNVATNSTASLAGMVSPDPTDTPMSREVIISMNNKPINNEADYYEFISELKPNRTILIKTDKGIYKLTTEEEFAIYETNETETKKIIEEVYDEKTNTTKNVTRKIEVPKTEKIFLGVKDLGLSVYNAPTTNIRKGLDLQGGTRVLLQPEESLEIDEMDLLLENMKTRLNIYGLSDIVVREAGDLSGNQYVLVEIAGAQEEEVRELLSSQGKFEAKVGNTTVFKGGQDITYVCRSADCSGIDPRAPCGQDETGQWACRFQFSISLNPEAAEKQAEATKDLEVIDGYLSEKLGLYLDDALVDELNIGEDLKGKASTDIAISGSGIGSTRDEAIYDSLENMKKLQTYLSTGSLSVKLNIVKTDSISATLGEEFVQNAIFIGLMAILGVAIVVFVRYRKILITLPMFFNSIFEVTILLGVAAMIGWNLDIAAIAGIIIVVGTGVDHQIIITDETLKGEIEESYNWKKRIKNAFAIIMAAYFTTAVAMLPLWFAGAGLLKGFALTTLIGISTGVFIVRPAYAAVVEILLKE